MIYTIIKGMHSVVKQRCANNERLFNYWIQQQGWWSVGRWYAYIFGLYLLYRSTTTMWLIYMTLFLCNKAKGIEGTNNNA